MISSILAETIEIIKEKSRGPLDEVRIEDLVIGVFFTGVKQSTGHGGCAFTPIGEVPEAVCCPTSADEMKHFKPESDMKTAIEKSRVVIITGTAIVNHTIDAVLSWINNEKRTAIIGPTASLLPDAFFKKGVSAMAGVCILNPDLMLNLLKQGGSAYHLLKECSEKIAFVK